MDTQLSPAALALLSEELRRSDLQAYTVVRMAAQDFDAGNVASAISRLRVDADKICMHSVALYELVMTAEPINTCRWCGHQWRHLMGKFCPSCHRFQ